MLDIVGGCIKYICKLNQSVINGLRLRYNIPLSIWQIKYCYITCENRINFYFFIFFNQETIRRWGIQYTLSLRCRLQRLTIGQYESTLVMTPKVHCKLFSNPAIMVFMDRSMLHSCTDSNTPTVWRPFKNGLLLKSWEKVI